MGLADTVTKAYMKENTVFADAFNYLIYGGKAVVDPAQLQELDTTEIALPFGAQDENGNQPDDAVQKYRERYNKTGIFECKLYPGVEKCIRTLKEQGYRIGMASSKPEVSCKRILEHFGILPLFDDVVGATFDGRRDKKSEILEEVMRRWSHIPKSEMCLIGDTMFDVNGAKELGIACLAVSFGFGDVKEMKEAGVIGVCDSMEELPGMLKK